VSSDQQDDRIVVLSTAPRAFDPKEIELAEQIAEGD
jgi:hypothetical protein